MRCLILLVCLAVGCLAQRPSKCRSPPLLTGSLSVSSASEKLMVYAKYSYDAWGKRIHLNEFVHYNNKSHHFDLLLLFREGVMYKIDRANQTCIKRKLCREFHPLQVPDNATLLGQAILGASSGIGQGLLVNTWTGQVKMKQGTGKYMSTVTEFGCIPVSTLFHTEKTGWLVTSFFNNVIGLVDPQELLPPSFCTDARLEENGEDPVNFFSFF
ncbi:ependymin-like [Sphaeramia orbicularis]|uniref:Ependymin-like n=1 Tax=Sphaeramia orbicularis TaxID=375764 RepID=A0A673AD61_9TELE|nr:ependymin-like [Sphaeramia orbicularis]